MRAWALVDNSLMILMIVGSVLGGFAMLRILAGERQVRIARLEARIRTKNAPPREEPIVVS
jgi:hypothetical protein